MKVYIANDARPQRGGGFSFLSYLHKGLGNDCTDNYTESDIFFVASASMIKPERAEEAKRDGKKVVLRVDNALRHSRNNGKGMSRMERMASIADLVVYQCEWSRNYLHDFLGKPKSTVIYNGIDLEIFTPDGTKTSFGSPTYLYASASKGENKRWDAAWYAYQMYQRKHPNGTLLIAGRVPTAIMENNFDFFNGERYQYLGMVSSHEKMASIYRSADYFFAVAENDCYSNALLESLACGAEPIEISYTGGTPELLDNWSKGREFNGIARMVDDYKEVFS